jgi:hypothetical protein
MTYSSAAHDDARSKQWWISFGIACMGSMEVLVGIVTGDSITQSLVMGIMVGRIE